MKNRSKENCFDAIVIGSGMGGMTTASLLAQLANKRVLVLEKHFKLGGFTHSFRRKEYEWDAGVHYIGQMQETSMARKIMDLVTNRRVLWNSMNRIYERLIFPKKTFEIPAGMNEFKSQLLVAFPKEKKGINQYFRDVKRAQSWVNTWFVAKLFPYWIGKILLYRGKRCATRTTKEYLDATFQCEEIKAIVAAQWPDFGSPPSESAFGFHATVSADFFDGGFYPVGGSKTIGESVKKVVESKGGTCLVSHEAIEVLVENGKAIGVKARHKGQDIHFYSPIVVSNVGAHNTFGKLVPVDYCQHERSRLASVKPGISALIVFVGLKDDPRKYGFDDANYWIYSRLDHDLDARDRDGDPERIDGVFVSFGSLRDPGRNKHTAQIVSFSHFTNWEHFEGTRWMNRGQEYLEKKESMMQSLIDYSENHLPGFKSLIEYREMSTPLTVLGFTSHNNGAVYGQPCDPQRLLDKQWRIETSLKNLYLTGADVGTPGVNGAMMAGVMTSAKILGPLGLIKIMSRAYRNPRS